MANCEASDVQAVAWENWGFCALATSEDGSCWGVGYSYGEGCTAQDAVNEALADCQGRTTQPVGIAAIVLSDGQFIYRGK